MHVVILDGDVSFPANSGKRLRTLNLMLQAVQRHRITYIGRCAAGSEEDRLAPAFLRGHGIESILVHEPVPIKTGVRFYARLAASLLSTRPYSVTSHGSDAMSHAVSEFASGGKVDVWQVEWSPYLAMIDPRLPGPRVLMAHNVDTLIWQRYYDAEPNLLKKAFIANQARKFRRFEKEAFQQATRVIAVSEEDARLIREEFGQPNTDVVDNGIDRLFFETVVVRRDPSCILFLGALDWRPNQDAIALLLNKIFPRVRSQEPSAKLSIVGRNPPPDLHERIRAIPGVTLHANVADVRPFLGESGVMAVPLRIGGGSRLKILEALACGLPVVSTRVGAEGLALEPGEHYVQAEEDAMAEALVRAIRGPAAIQAMADLGRRLVLKTYDWGVLTKKLEASWEKSLQPTS